MPQFAFYGCISLKRITIPFVGENLNGSQNTHFGYIFGANYYMDNSAYVPESLKEVIITGGESIGEYAFYECTNLESITIISSVQSIGSWSFRYCTSLQSISIPSSVTSIGGCAFEGCASLQTITIPSSVTSIRNNGLFYGCISLESIIVDPNNPKYDSRDNCNAIIETSTNTLIAGCQNTVIPSSVTSIGPWAFAGCTSLESITIPSSVTSIMLFTFLGCANLSSIIVDPNNPKYDSRDNCNAIIETSTNTLIAGCKDTIIPSSVTSIGTDAFYKCTSLERITIPFSVTSIEDSAFSGCTNLESITIPSSVTSIGYYAFSGCTNLSEVIFEDPNNWVVNKNILSFNDLNNPSIAASYLRDEYCNYIWDKK